MIVANEEQVAGPQSPYPLGVRRRQLDSLDPSDATGARPGNLQFFGLLLHRPAELETKAQVVDKRREIAAIDSLAVASRSWSLSKANRGAGPSRGYGDAGSRSLGTGGRRQSRFGCQVVGWPATSEATSKRRDGGPQAPKRRRVLREYHSANGTDDSLRVRPRPMLDIADQFAKRIGELDGIGRPIIIGRGRRANCRCARHAATSKPATTDLR